MLRPYPGVVVLPERVDGWRTRALAAVYATRGAPPIVQQHRVALPNGAVHIDGAIPELKIAVELDGAAFHGSAADRERDTRRDVALAALDWVVLLFSYQRLVTEPDACRREILAVCRARAALLSRR